MTLPNFLIIGELKGGTTSLWHYCNEHSDVFMCSLKEPRFFAFDNANPEHLKAVPRAFPVRTMEEYINLFEGAKHEKAIGEASPNYFSSPIAARRIRQSLPDAKLIASLRSPADRVYSRYLMRVRAGKETRKFITAFREEADVETRGVKSSFAYENLRRYYDTFDAGHLKVILFEDLKENAAKTMEDVFQFLDVSSDFTPDVSVVYNPGGMPKNKVLHITYRLFIRNERLKYRLKSWLPRSGIAAAKTLRRRNFQKSPPLEPQARKEIIDYYREDILRLQDLIRRDLSQWFG